MAKVKQVPEACYNTAFKKTSQNQKVPKDNLIWSRSKIWLSDFGKMKISLLQVPSTSLTRKMATDIPQQGKLVIESLHLKFVLKKNSVGKNAPIIL